MMRTKNEIRQAVAILRHKGDRISMLQAATLEEGRNEAWVFATYVTSVPEDAKDEAAFFAARDAARFAAGHIGLEELVPDVQSMTAADFAAAGALGNMVEEEGSVTLSRKDFNNLIKRIDRLEQWIGLSRKDATLKPKAMPEGMDMTDMMKQNEACAYLECGKNTIKKWAAKGLVQAYQKGKYVYYSKKELDKKIKRLRKEE
nr:helix-turn-helix domain-containing protein [uncultured Bacteroides sp.]